MLTITQPEDLEESIKLVNAFVQEELDRVWGRIRFGSGGFSPGRTPEVDKKIDQRKKELKQEILDKINTFIEEY